MRVILRLPPLGRTTYDIINWPGRSEGVPIGDEAMTIWLKLGVGLAALTIPAVLREAGYAADAAHPTVVELFQSQGCSDCPPAAANVAAISDRPDVLALSLAVDHWDRLGWKDTFSKPAWTAREYAYAHAMRRDDVYTPPAAQGRPSGAVGT